MNKKELIDKIKKSGAIPKRIEYTNSEGDDGFNDAIASIDYDKLAYIIYEEVQKDIREKCEHIWISQGYVTSRNIFYICAKCQGSKTE